MAVKDQSNNYQEASQKFEVEDEEETTEEPTFVSPDGGWGWVVVFSSFMIHVIADGVTYTFGIFYMEFLKYFQESKGTTAWVASIMVGTTFCIGPVASGLTNKYGCRTVTIMGSLLATTGLLLSLVAPNVVYLFFTIGICTGAGFGLMYLPAIVCVSCYFEKKRAFATGIAVCGSGIGTFALAPFTEILVEKYGWKGAMLVISGLVLNCCVFGALFRPLEMKKLSRASKQEKVNKLIDKENTCNGIARKGSLQIESNGTVENSRDFIRRPSRTVSLPLHQKVETKHLSLLGEMKQTILMTTSLTFTPQSSNPESDRRLSQGLLYRKDIFYSGSIRDIQAHRSNGSLPTKRASVAYQKKDTKQTIKDFFRCSKEMQDAFLQMTDFTLMRNWVFLMFGLSNFFTNIGFNVPYVYTKDRAVDMGIAQEDDASFLLSVIGIANTVGRVILGYLSDKKWVNRLWLYNTSLTICGLSTAFSSFCKDYTLMATYASAFGATAGAYVSLTSVILVDLLGLDNLTNAFGLLLVFEGVACLIGPPITGWLYDGTGSYDPGFFVSGSMIAVSGLMLFFIPCVQKLNEKREAKNKDLQLSIENEETTFEVASV